MPTYARLLLPTEVADDLVSDRTAVRPIGTRGGGVVDVYKIVVDSINTGAAAVSVVMAAATCRRLAQAVIRRRRPADPARATLTITIGDHSETLEVDLTAADAEERLFEFFASQLHVG